MIRVFVSSLLRFAREIFIYNKTLFAVNNNKHHHHITIMADTTTTTKGSKHKFELNKEKLAQLKQGAAAVRTGGKGSMRRKVKNVPTKVSADDAKMMGNLRKLGCQQVPEIEEVAMFMTDDTVKVFQKPKVQAAPGKGLFVVSGANETKRVEDFPGALFGGSNAAQLQQILAQLQLQAQQAQKGGAMEASDIPEDVNFDVRVLSL